MQHDGGREAPNAKAEEVSAQSGVLLRERPGRGGQELGGHHGKVARAPPGESLWERRTSVGQRETTLRKSRLSPRRCPLGFRRTGTGSPGASLVGEPLYYISGVSSDIRHTTYGSPLEARSDDPRRA